MSLPDRWLAMLSRGCCGLLTLGLMAAAPDQGVPPDWAAVMHQVFNQQPARTQAGPSQSVRQTGTTQHGVLPQVEGPPGIAMPRAGDADRATRRPAPGAPHVITPEHSAPAFQPRRDGPVHHHVRGTRQEPGLAMPRMEIRRPIVPLAPRSPFVARPQFRAPRVEAPQPLPAQLFPPIGAGSPPSR